MNPSGSDFNLTRRCVKSTAPRLANYYEDLSGCPPPQIPGIPCKSWTIAVSSENGQTSGVCPEPEDQSFPINHPYCPVTLNWVPHESTLGPNWAVNLKTDLYNFTHPCDAGHFTWSMFMDHANYGGGPLPRPDQLRMDATVSYNDYCPNGASRLLALFQGYWNGKVRYFEIHLKDTNWGVGLDDHLVVAKRENITSQYLALRYGAFLPVMEKCKDTAVSIDWAWIINALIVAGHVPHPDGGWQNGWQNTSTLAVGLGHEVHNWGAVESAVADTWFTDLRIYSS